MSDEREGAMLTKTQRAFLKGEKEYTGENARQQRYQRRQAIKKRVHNTLLDFQLLFETWDERGSGPIFGENLTSGEVGNALKTTLGLIYSEAYERRAFEILLSAGVRMGDERIYPDRNDMVTVDFEVKRVQHVDIENALKQYRSRSGYKEMSKYELAALAQIFREEKGREAVKEITDAWEEKKSHFPEVFEEDGGE